MGKFHGLSIPDKSRLVVDVETFLAYIHLIVFGYFECLYCGVQRRTAEVGEAPLPQRFPHSSLLILYYQPLYC